MSAGVRLTRYIIEYQGFFKNKTKRNFDKAQLYVEGILLSDLNNIERINETLDEDYHRMHHFISDAKWEARTVMDKVAGDVSRVLSNQKLTGMLIDESGNVKKGDKSVGVGHQYCGNVGKTANSQVAVYGCLCNDKHASLVDARLYLPKSWTDDKKRCDEAKIPLNRRKFKSKPELALEIVKHQMAIGVKFDYVGADGLYGNDLTFAQELDKMCLTYMLDIHSDQQAYLERPKLFLPERKSSRGRPPQRLKADIDPVKVKDHIDGLPSWQWKEITIRNSAKGKLKGLFHFKQVYVWDKKTNRVERRLLVVSKRKTKQGLEIKYSFTNADLVQYTEKAIAQMQAQRFFIEHSFKEQKQILKMDQFQTRKWLAWHHQMALNMMVGSFMLREKLLAKEAIPLLSARDIKDFVTLTLSREMTGDRMLRQLKERHFRRQKDIDRYESNE